MSRFISREAGRLEPYIPGEQPVDMQYIKLNTNEEARFRLPPKIGEGCFTLGAFEAEPLFGQPATG